MKKRLSSILIALSLLLTLLPAQVFAEEVVVESAYAAEETVIEQTSAEEGTPVEEGVPVVEEVPVAESPTGEGTPAEEPSAEVESVTGETLAEEGQPSDEAMPTDENPVEEEPVAEEDQVAPLVLTCTSSVALPDNDTLLMEYFYQENGGSYSETVPYNTAQQDAYYAAVLPDGCQEFYNQLVTGVEAIARRSGGNDTAAVTINWSGIDQGAVSANFDAIYSALLLNVPQYLYWHDKTLGVRLYGNTMYFQVAKGYRVEKTTTIGGYPVYITLDGERMTRVNTALANANNVLTSHAAEIDFAKLTSYKDEICALTDYNYGAASGSGMQAMGSDPWQMIYVFDGDPNTTVVCEGYSKAFKYLCDLSSWNNAVECILVTGVTDGPHMWNVVKIEGRNYLADITNCDSGWNLFLCGVSSTTSPYSAAGLTYNLDEEMYTLYSEADLVMSTEAYTPTTTPEPVKNGLIEEGGTWYYYVDGVVDTSYIGLVPYNGAWYYVSGGQADFAYTGLSYYQGTWYYVHNGVVDFGYNGIAWHGGAQYMDASGNMGYSASGWYFILGGVVNWDFIGLTYYAETNTWYYVSGGVVDWSYTGLSYYQETWRYVCNGVANFDYNGIAWHGGAQYMDASGNMGYSAAGWYFILDGEVNWDFIGLTYYTETNTWYYVSGGVVDWNYTGLSYYQGTWRYVCNGVANFDYNGIAWHGGAQYMDASGNMGYSAAGWYFILDGEVNWDFIGLTYYTETNTWYYVSGGVVDWSYTGLSYYNGNWYYVSGGVVDFGYSGEVYYAGSYYYDDAGDLQYGTPGTYHVVGGVVQF